MRKIGRPDGAVGALPAMAFHGVDWGTGKIEVLSELIASVEMRRSDRLPRKRRRSVLCHRDFSASFFISRGT
jgi:hypothetical protein